MHDQLFEALRCWARKPTWFTGHPSDESNFKLAVSNVKKLPFTPTKDEIYETILEHQKDAPAVLGTPKDIRPQAEQFAIKIAKKL
ncbi:hypothetical protein [Methylophaga sp.]|uniref:hypothetical protein n=1 Tax=Methylophaga sp. TaxID=2024840 RepID=UPI003A8D0F5F